MKTNTGTAFNQDVRIHYETIGDPGDPGLLLIMGQGGQLIGWPAGLCALLAERGFCVARFDNRDAGLSTHFTDAGVPGRRMITKPASAAVYTLDDMAADSVAVLDALGWAAAHIVGVSMGGMIAQVLAVNHPARVRTLTSMSSTPFWRIGLPKLRTLIRLSRVAKRPIRDADDADEQTVAIGRITRSPGYPYDDTHERETARRAYERGYDPAAIQRQSATIAAAGDRRRALGNVTAPTLVLHGDADPMIRPAGGRATAKAIPGARLVTLPGCGHDLPRQLWPWFVDEVCALADAAPATASVTRRAD